MIEEWKIYVDKRAHTRGCLWEVSNLGRVRKNGKIYECKPNGAGYLCGGVNFVHRMVAEMFIPNPENKPTVNHKDHNRLNNTVDNLEWFTYSEQISDPERMGKWKEKRKEYTVSDETKKKSSIISKTWWATENPEKIAARNKKISDYKKEWWRKQKNISI